jgi:hypothetical protein
MTPCVRATDSYRSVPGASDTLALYPLPHAS